jgi:hypothetical protein
MNSLFSDLEFLRLSLGNLRETVRIEHERLQRIAAELNMPAPEERQGYTGQHDAFTIIKWLRDQLDAKQSTCNGTCNPYVAPCGAQFCTSEELAEHERTHDEE